MAIQKLNDPTRQFRKVLRNEPARLSAEILAEKAKAWEYAQQYSETGDFEAFQNLTTTRENIEFLKETLAEYGYEFVD